MAISGSLHDRISCSIRITCVLGGSGISCWTTKKYQHNSLSSLRLGIINSIVHADTCDPTWQSSSNSLISLAHVSSDISFLIAIGGLLLAVIYYKFKGD